MSFEDYPTYLRAIATEEDWEALPAHLQDAIDLLLIDEVRSANKDTFDLEALLTDSEL